MPTFGADPDAPDTGWEEPTPKPYVRMRPAVYDLVSYFMYHKKMAFTQRANDTDRAVLAQFFSARLGRGFTSASLKAMVDRFWETPAGESPTPALSFVSHKVQEDLAVHAAIESDNPYMKWLLDGMPDSVDVLDDPAGTRRAILFHASDLVLRYPDMVVDVLSAGLSAQRQAEVFSILNDLVRWNLEEIDTFDLRRATALESMVAIPPALLTRRPSPNSVSRVRKSLKEAIAANHKKRVYQ